MQSTNISLKLKNGIHLTKKVWIHDYGLQTQEQTTASDKKDRAGL